MRTLLMTITAVVAILMIIWLQQFGYWTTLTISIFLIIMLILVTDKSSIKWKYWLASVLAISYLSSLTGLRVRKTEEGRIQLVRTLYPICPKILIEGNKIDTLELATEYSTFAGWFYSVKKSKYYAIRDSNKQTTICSFRPFMRFLRGRQMTIEEYQGSHGIINIFSYIDDAGNQIRRDLYGQNPDDESYTVHVMDNAEYIPAYIP